jgi:hypothetical protein
MEFNPPPSDARSAGTPAHPRPLRHRLCTLVQEFDPAARPSGEPEYDADPSDVLLRRSMY